MSRVRTPKKQLAKFAQLDPSQGAYTKILKNTWVQLLPGQTKEQAEAKYAEIMRVKIPKKKRLV
jgi:hypothetical protein